MQYAFSGKHAPWQKETPKETAEVAVKDPQEQVKKFGYKLIQSNELSGFCFVEVGGEEEPRYETIPSLPQLTREGRLDRVEEIVYRFGERIYDELSKDKKIEENLKAAGLVLRWPPMLTGIEWQKTDEGFRGKFRTSETLMAVRWPFQKEEKKDIYDFSPSSQGFIRLAELPPLVQQTLTDISFWILSQFWNGLLSLDDSAEEPNPER